MFGKGKYTRIKKEKKHRFSRKTIVIGAALLLVAVCGAIGGTSAWLAAQGEPVINTFGPSQVSCEVEEAFDKDTGVKENVQVTNTSDISAYIRVRLVSYNKDAQGNIVGGDGSLPEDKDLNLENWIKIDGYYYCKAPVKAGELTPVLIKKYQLAKGRVLEVLAEAIQSEPKHVVKGAWKVTVDDTGAITGEREEA